MLNPFRFLAIFFSFLGTVGWVIAFPVVCFSALAVLLYFAELHQAEAASRAPRVDAGRFRADLDVVIDQRIAVGDSNVGSSAPLTPKPF
jgi:hypothetical protein